MKLESFLIIFSKNSQISIFMKIRKWEPSCSMRTDGQVAKHDKASSRFLQFCKCACKTAKVLTMSTPLSAAISYQRLTVCRIFM